MELIHYDSDQRQRFPKNLVRLRKERGLSKNKLARRLGWAYNTITAWERGGTYAEPRRNRGPMLVLWNNRDRSSRFARQAPDVCLLSQRQAHGNGNATRDSGSDWGENRELAESIIKVEKSKGRMEDLPRGDQRRDSLYYRIYTDVHGRRNRTARPRVASK